MNRKKGIWQLVLLVVLIAFFAFTAINGLGSDKSGSIYDIKQGLDLAGGVSITYTVVDDNPSSEAINDTKLKLQKRVESYSSEAEVYLEGSDRINVDIPGVQDANKILEELGQPGTLSFKLSDGTEVLNGNMIVDAQAYSTKNQTTNSVEYGVELTLNEEGRAAFAEATAANVGNVINIIYDNQTISSPRVDEAIDSETCQITKISSWDEAETLASNIRVGALPLELKELRSNVVGAKLGEAAVSTSLMAALIAIALIIVFMIVVYRVPGVAASLALILYVFMIVMLLSTFQVTMTLSGIAGIVLSIGMAVDANVVIFARIREEIANGRSVQGAIKGGFDKALSAIVDGNVTTLIAAVVLYILGSGTIRGFATTLGLGVVLSMFTALVITRLALNGLYNIGLQSEKMYGKAKMVKPLHIVEKKFLWIAVSCVVILTGIGSMVINNSKGNNALNFSLDFIGGTSTNVMLNEDLTIEEIHSEILPIVEEVAPNAGAQANKVVGSNEIIIKTRELTLDERNALNDALCEKFGIDESAISPENISATVGRETQRSAIEAVLVSLVLMLLYIWFRFKDIRFATSSIIALAHDVLVVITFYAVLRWSVGNTFIACILTVLGYSINATIIIFDRVREELSLAKPDEDLNDIANRAITATLSRSINTSITTLIAVLTLYIMGVSNMQAFALPLIVGVICGAYSSVCLAGSMWRLMHHKAKTVADLKRK